MSESDSSDRAPVLPPKDPLLKPRGSTVNLPEYLWGELDAIAAESGEYSRNEVIQLFLENRVAAYKKEQSAKRLMASGPDPGPDSTDPGASN